MHLQVISRTLTGICQSSILLQLSIILLTCYSIGKFGKLKRIQKFYKNIKTSKNSMKILEFLMHLCSTFWTCFTTVEIEILFFLKTLDFTNSIILGSIVYWQIYENYQLKAYWVFYTFSKVAPEQRLFILIQKIMSTSDQAKNNGQICIHNLYLLRIL